MKPINQRRRFVLLLAVLGLSFLTSVFTTQAYAQETLSPADAQLLARLDAPAWTTREAALIELESGKWEPARLRALYHGTDSPEAKDRVLTAAKHLYFKSLWTARSFAGESAAMGFTFPPKPTLVQPVGAQMPLAGLFVSAPLCGMPSVVKLKPGDRVLTIGGADFANLAQESNLPDLLRVRLSRYKPGQSLDLTIERDGQQLEVELELAPREAMVEMFLSGGFGVSAEIAARWLVEREKLVAFDPANG